MASGKFVSSVPKTVADVQRECMKLQLEAADHGAVAALTHSASLSSAQRLKKQQPHPNAQNLQQRRRGQAGQAAGAASETRGSHHHHYHSGSHSGSDGGAHHSNGHGSENMWFKFEPRYKSRSNNEPVYVGDPVLLASELMAGTVFQTSSLGDTVLEEGCARVEVNLSATKVNPPHDHARACCLICLL